MSAPAYPLPTIGSRLTLTDSSHRVEQSNAWLTCLARRGDSMYVIYLSAYSPSHVSDGRIFLRRFSLSSLEIQAPAQVFSRTQSPIAPVGDGYRTPTLLCDSSGNLMALHGFQDYATLESGGTIAYGTYTTGLARLLTNPDDPASWGPETPSGGHLRTRMLNEFYHANWDLRGYYPLRPMTLRDRNTGMSYILSSCHSLRSKVFDGSTLRGGWHLTFHRVATPLSIPSSADGPYVLIENDSRTFDEFPSGGAAGVEAAPKLLIGRESSGIKKLYLLWTYRAYFNSVNVLWNYDLHLAISEDGGLSWRNADGSHSQHVTTRIKAEDSRFRILPGEYRSEFSEWGADVDADGNLHVLVHRYVDESQWYTPGTTHVNGFAIADFGSMVLSIIHLKIAPNGTVYEYPAPLLTRAHLPHRIQLVCGNRGELFVNSEMPLQYNYSADDGVTWRGWTILDPELHWNTRLYAQLLRDPDDDSLAHLLYHDVDLTYSIDVCRLYYRSIRFGSLPQQLPPDEEQPSAPMLLAPLATRSGRRDAASIETQLGKLAPWWAR